MNSDVNLHLRNNIIKLQSLVHNQLSSPRYINIFKQGWFKSNYIYKKPDNFDNPVEFGFGGSQPHCEIPGCKNEAIIRCSWCQKYLCFKHFTKRRYCSTLCSCILSIRRIVHFDNSGHENHHTVDNPDFWNFWFKYSVPLNTSS